MKKITVKQAKTIDLKARQELGIMTLVIMENAGIKTANFALKILKRKAKNKVAVFCGKGNNAGDGLVVSRQLICAGVDVDTFLLAPGYSLSPVARKNLNILKRISQKIYRIQTEGNLKKIDFSSYGLLIDAIFGIGLRGQLQGVFKAAIEAINLCAKTIISIDLPSGLDAELGRVLGAAVKADYTVTFVAAKRGMFINQGPRYSGKIIVEDIGFPGFFVD